MCFLKDIHTHQLPSCAEKVLLSVCYGDARNGLMQQAVHLSVGIHPWHLTEEDFALQVDWLKERLDDKRVLALGEAGLDKRCDTPFDLQLEAFRMQIEWAESFQLPLVIHAVKCMDELIHLKKECKPESPWIIHGFRGKPQQAAEYVRHGFYLSFGEKYAEESLRSVPLECLFIETDESRVPVEVLYQRAAGLRALSVTDFEYAVLENINRVFY